MTEPEKLWTAQELLDKCADVEETLEAEAEPETAKGSGKVVSWKKRRKVLLMVAAVAVLGLGTTMVTQGNRWYELRQYPIQTQRNVIANHNSVAKADQIGDLKEAYKNIEQSLGIVVFKLGDIPSDMRFEQLILDDDYATLKFVLAEKNIYFKQRKAPDKKEISEVVISDRKEYMKVYNEWLDYEFPVEKNTLDNGLVEYSAGLIENDVLYYLSGIMNEDIFIDLIKGIHK